MHVLRNNPLAKRTLGNILDSNVINKVLKLGLVVKEQVESLQRSEIKAILVF